MANSSGVSPLFPQFYQIWYTRYHTCFSANLKCTIFLIHYHIKDSKISITSWWRQPCFTSNTKNGNLVRDHAMIIHVQFWFNQVSRLCIYFPIWLLVKSFWCDGRHHECLINRKPEAHQVFNFTSKFYWKSWNIFYAS
jgi:hypothetical protein